MNFKSLFLTRKIFTLVLLSILFLSVNIRAQFDTSKLDTTVDNLILPEWYQTSKLGELPEVVKMGSGSKDMILIPGWGFGWEIYRDFMKSNSEKYTMYAITIPGFGYTQSPSLPDSGTSYGDHIWNIGVVEGIKKLIEKENLQRPILLTNFLQGPQIAFWFAYKYADLIDGIIVIGGIAKNVAPNRNPTLAQRVDYVDNFLVPKWFKHVPLETWHWGNFTAEQYSKDSVRAQVIWNKSAFVPIPILVQYLCEIFASDISLRFNELQVPALVIIPEFDNGFKFTDNNAYVKNYFHDSWQGAEELNKLISIKYIKNSRLFIMDDQPEELNHVINTFIKENLK